MSTPAPDSVKRLVDRFDQDRKVFLSGDYKEEQPRAGFPNPLFDTLGRDTSSKAGLTEAFKSVIHTGACFARGEARVAGGESSHITKARKPDRRNR